MTSSPTEEILEPCALLVPCPLYLVPCPLSLVPCPLSLLSHYLCYYPIFQTTMAPDKTKKTLLLERFDLARHQNAELIEEISQFVRANNASETHFMQGYSFESGVKMLEEQRDLVFNLVNRQAILDAEDNAQELDFLIDRIEGQINHYAEIKMGLNVFFKSIN